VDAGDAVMAHRRDGTLVEEGPKMASRDRSQGFGFVYVNIPELLKRRHELFAEDAPIPSAEVTDEAVINLNIARPENISLVTANEISAESPKVEKLKHNLDRLQGLHHKLHAMLEELNQITKKKKSD